MKIYQVTDGMRAKRMYAGTIERANFIGSVWITELSEKYKDAESWVKIDELSGKKNIIDALNLGKEI